MKIYYPIIYEGKRPNENPLYLLSYLRSHSDIAFSTHTLTPQNMSELENSEDNYILLSVTSLSPFYKFHHLLMMLRKTFRHIKCKIIVGGAVFYILNHQDVLKHYPEITHICVGKGEEVLKAIIEKNLPRGVYSAQNFDRVQKYLLIPEFAVKDVVMLTFRDSRCSWGKCLFCHHQTRCMYPNKNAADVAHEVMHYIDAFGTRYFYFFDNHMEPETLAEFLEILFHRGYAKFHPQFYVFGIRVDGNLKALNPILQKWPKATIDGIAWGVEFYDQEILDRFKKGTSLAQIDTALDFFPKYGTVNDVYILLGLPTITQKNIAHHERFIEKQYNNIFRLMTSFFLFNDGLKISEHSDEFKINKLDYQFTLQDFFMYAVDIPPIRTVYTDFTSWDEDLQKYASRGETFLKYLSLYQKFNKIGTCPRLSFLDEKTHTILKKIRPDLYFG
ncbi:MAG: radical SAM protein [uncultured bacterium]|nr:MAG: radical SAM protein [uncultured bacterium]HLD44641.1 hypothetical protein [bacterium]